MTQYMKTTGQMSLDVVTCKVSVCRLWAVPLSCMMCRVQLAALIPQMGHQDM